MCKFVYQYDNQPSPRFLMSVMMLHTYMYPCGMVSHLSYNVLFFLGRHGLGLYTRELIQFVKGSTINLLKLGPSQGLGPIIFGIDWIYLFTHIIRIKLLIIYTIVKTSLMSGPPYQYLV